MLESKSNDALDALPLSVAIYMNDLRVGGVERQCVVLARELQVRGLRVSLVLHQAKGDLRAILPPSLAVVDLNGRRTLEDIPLLAAYLRRARPDILLANLDHNNLAALLAKAMSVSRTKVVICQHNALSRSFTGGERWTYRLIPLGYNLLSPLVSAAVAVSGGLAEELARLARLNRRKIVTINNPAIETDFAARAEETVAHPWLAERESSVIVTVGRLVEQKDHDTLLRAVAIQHGRAPIRLLVLGDGPLRVSLESTARSLGIAESVQFLGFVQNPLPYVRAADAFVLSSRSEGFGNALVEAMGCGTPVIATDCPHGPAEILERGRYGILTPPGDAAALGGALASVPSLRARFPAGVLEARADAFTASACAARYEGLFRTLLESDPRRVRRKFTASDCGARAVVP